MKFHLITLTALIAITLTNCNDKQQQATQDQAPLPVPVASALIKKVSLTETYTGRFTATEMVEVRSRVSGYIEKIHFKEGQEIKAGQPMFSIDPSIFQAELDNVNARVKQIETSIKLANSNLERAKSLVAKNAISREELDIRQAEFDLANANLESAKAQAKEAELNRGFADITAPISGIAGRYLVTRKNYITGGNASAQVLTTIVPHNPIDVYFEVDERQVLNFTRLFMDGKTSGRDGKRPSVDIAVSDSDKFEFTGEIDFADNLLDQSTATLQLRARVENENKFLTPGLFAKVRIPVGTEAELMLVRESALGFDQDKRFVWVLQPDNTLTKAYVEIGTLQTDMRVITSGLKPEDKIAIGRIQFLRPNTPVNPIATEMDPTAASKQ